MDDGSNGPEANQSAEGMEDLFDAHGHEYRSLKRGDIIEGVVVRIDKDEVLVDIGSKSEGVIPLERCAILTETPRKRYTWVTRSWPTYSSRRTRMAMWFSRSTGRRRSAGAGGSKAIRGRPGDRG